MGTKKGEWRSTARRAYEPKKKSKRKYTKSGRERNIGWKLDAQIKKILKRF